MRDIGNTKKKAVMKAVARSAKLYLPILILLGLVSAAPASAADFGIRPGSLIGKTHPTIALGPPTSLGSFTRMANVNGPGGIAEAEPIRQAGAHPDGTVSLALNVEGTGGAERAIEYARDVTVDLPAGFMGNPEVATVCRRAIFEGSVIQPAEAGCAPSSQVGVATVELYGAADSSYPVYRINRAARSPASFGFVFARQPIILNPRVRSEGDYGLSVDAVQIASVPVSMKSVTVTLWGVPADSIHDGDRWDYRTGDWGVAAGVPSRPFLINPPRCNTGELATRVSMRSWQQSDKWLPRDLTDPTLAQDYVAWAPEPDGCDRLPKFQPDLDMRPGVTAAATPAGYDVKLSMPYNDDPDGQAFPYLKRAEVTLPEGVSVSPSAAHGLVGCTDRQAGFGTQSVANCPDAAKIGQVSVTTPLLPEPIRGGAYLGAPTQDQLLRLFLILEGYGVTVRVAGDIETDPDTGQVTAVFDDNPQIPFTELDLKFDSGQQSSLINPVECGTHTTVTRLTAWNGDVTESRSSFRISADGRGGSCPSSRPFDPWLTGGTVNPVAGEYSPFVLRFGREDVEQEIDSIGVEMPGGLVAKIAGVELCPPDRADAGTCGGGSKIGHTQIASGAGTQPFWVPGPGKDATSVFLSGPYRGAPYSLSIVVPAQAGPFDLGRVVVRAPINVHERTADLSIGIAESRVFNRFGSLAGVIPGRMPTVLEGIPLKVKEIRVIVDREEFMLNPTNCSAKQIRAEIGSAQGASARVSEHFQAADCAALPFQPRFVARVMDTGRRSTVRSFNPRMRFTVLPREGDANMGPTQVILPPSVILDQGNIKTTCTRAQFADRACPQRAIYGFARAWSPLLDRPVRGPVYMASNGGARLLPDLVADLDGPVRIVLRGWVDSAKGGRLRNTFKVVPDVPVSRFDLTMFGGRNRGLLVNSADLCRDRTRGVARFIGANGKRSVQRPPIRLRYKGCKRVRKQAMRQAAKRKAARGGANHNTSRRAARRGR